MSEWKPGPPPLDRPGRYVAVFNDGERRAIRVDPSAGNVVAADAPWGEPDIFSAITVVMHYEIPDPPASPPS